MDDIKNRQRPLKVALYIRVSTEEQAEKYGPELQKDALNGLIKSKGLLLNGKPSYVLAGEKYIYSDRGVSGTTLLDERPEFARMKEDVLLSSEDNRPFDIVAVYKIDRFARKLTILLDIIDFFESYNIGFVSATESIDTSTPFGRAILNIIGVIAELERETIKQRTQAGREQAAKRGVLMGSFSAYGYVKNNEKFPIIFEEEAKIVREIFDLFVNQKRSAYEIAQQLTSNKILSKEASAVQHEKKKGDIKKKTNIFFWRDEAVRNILRDEIYIGKLYYNKGTRGKIAPKEQWKLAEYEVPPIIDELTFEKAQSLLETSKHEKKHTRSNHTYLLSGLLRCDSCFDESQDVRGRTHWNGDRKKVKKSGRFTYSYKCGRKNPSKHEKRCHTIPLPAHEIEKYIIDFCKKLIKNPVAVYNHQIKLRSSKTAIKHLKNKEDEIRKALRALPIQKERLLEQHQHGYMDSKTLDKRIRDIHTRESELKKRQNELKKEISQNILSEEYNKTLQLFSEKYKNDIEKILVDRSKTYELVHLLIEEIIVYSRPVKDTDKIAGIRKKDQKIPFRIHIKLKLPQEILQDLTDQFGVKNTPLSG